MINSIDTLQPLNISSLQVDDTWIVQGRIVPPSCTKGAGCILYLQTRQKDWPIEHFHIGHSKIPPEMGVEVAMTILQPPTDILITYSFDAEERSDEIDYLTMIKIVKPKDTIGFVTTNGLVFCIQIPGLEEMFGKNNQCRICSNMSGNLPAINTTADLDDILARVEKNEKNH